MEQKVPPEDDRGLSEIAVIIRQIRRILDLTQPEFGPIVGVSGKSYPSYETGQRNPDESMLEKAKAYYKEKTGVEWASPRPVPPGTIGGSTWSQLPEERKAAAVERALAKGEAPLGMTQDEAIQRAYVILGEVKVAMPQLRELWTQREEGAFLAGVTRLLTAAQRSELADGLQNILVQIAKVASSEGKRQKEDAG
jgi:DNA-binding XRE family transcriptional regulator